MYMLARPWGFVVVIYPFEKRGKGWDGSVNEE
jgi:hypothetical protein